MKDRIKKVNKKVLIAAIKSIISVSFKKLDNMIFVFSKDTKAIYNDNNLLVKDKNSFINLLIILLKMKKLLKKKK